MSLAVETVTKYRVGEKEFNTEKEANDFLKKEGQKKVYFNILTEYAETLQDDKDDKNEYYDTEKELFNDFLDGLSEFLAKKFP